MAGASTTVRKGSPGVAVTRSPLALPLVLLPVAAALGWMLASRPELYRPIFALGVLAVLGLLALRWPNAAILGGLLFLPLVGLIRRLLIESTGWPEIDPLLLIGPALAALLFVKSYVLESRPLAPDLLSKLVLAFLIIVLFSVLNPLGIGLNATGAVALVLTAVPLVWFFVGRALPDRMTIAQLQCATAFLAAAIAIYGLWQTQVGFPSWDRAWIDVGGYGSLAVGEQIRAWGTLASAFEYAGFLGAGMIFAAAALLHRRAWPVLLLPLLFIGILFSSHRTTLVFVLLALAVMLGLRSSRPRIALPTIAVLGVILYLVSAPVLASVSSTSNNDLISHQLGGIARPFDDDSSTADDHLTMVKDGLAQSLRTPMGLGVAPPSGPAESSDLRFQPGGTELDFSDTFVRFGLPGGLLFLTILGVTFATAGRRYTRGRDPLVLGAVGLAVATIGYWLNGGYYALIPLLWLMLGWATRPDEGARRAAGRDQPRT